MSGFDVVKFAGAKFRDRTAVVPVPELAVFFPEGEPAEFVVRGLTGEELASAREAMHLNAAVGMISESAALSDRVKNAFLTLTGSTQGKVPNEYALRIAMVRIGAGLEQEVVVRLGVNFPIVFGQLAMKIDQLTGLGRALEGE